MTTTTRHHSLSSVAKVPCGHLGMGPRALGLSVGCAIRRHTTPMGVRPEANVDRSTLRIADPLGLRELLVGR